MCIYVPGPTGKQQRLHRGRQAVRSQPDAGGDSDVVVGSRGDRAVRRAREKQSGRAASVLGRVRQPLFTAEAESRTAPVAGGSAETGRVRQARATAVQRGRQGQEENSGVHQQRRNCGRLRSRQSRGRDDDQTPDDGHARLIRRGRARSAADDDTPRELKADN